MGKIVRAGAGAGAGIFDKLELETELEPDKNGPAPQHWFTVCPAAAKYGTYVFLMRL
jgi:hypothetical protein